MGPAVGRAAGRAVGRAVGRTRAPTAARPTARRRVAARPAAAARAAAREACSAGRSRTSTTPSAGSCPDRGRTRGPSGTAGGGSAEDGVAVHQQPVEGLLDRLADLVGHVEDQHRVVGRTGLVVVGADRLAELQQPLRGQRDQAERPEPREERGDRDVRQAQQPGQGRDVADHRVDLLRADHRERDDRDARAQRGRDEAAAPEALQLVALGVRLADALEALRPHADQLAPAQHPLGVLLAGQGRARLAGQGADDGEPEDEVGAQGPQETAGVVVHADHGHQAVDGDRAGVVRDHQRAPDLRDVLGAPDLDPEPRARQRSQRGQQEPLGDLGVEAVLVDGVVAGQPSAPERQQPGQLRLPLLAEDLTGRGLQRPEPLGRRRLRERVPLLGARRGAAPGRGRHRRRLDRLRARVRRGGRGHRHEDRLDELLGEVLDGGLGGGLDGSHLLDRSRGGMSISSWGPWGSYDSFTGWVDDQVRLDGPQGAGPG
ncbi:hypothetical protein NOCARDAX2BIS_480023 [Nocardioides sp. AX2bis]|nr:hypothetical protein NOCARDAX2BIS_480023 [Nocardioides sp. AX2bis]